METVLQDTIAPLLAEFLVALLSLMIAWLVGRLAVKMKAEAKDDKLSQLLYLLVTAADQTLKKSDPTGQIRKQSVMTSLRNLGYAVDELMQARIESMVWEVNQENPVTYELIEESGE